jgi:very-short-patch-repair endonuclease
VLRFWNNEVFENMEGVLHVIARAVGIPDLTSRWIDR